MRNPHPPKTIAAVMIPYITRSNIFCPILKAPLFLQMKLLEALETYLAVFLIQVNVTTDIVTAESALGKLLATLAFHTAVTFTTTASYTHICHVTTSLLPLLLQ